MGSQQLDQDPTRKRKAKKNTKKKASAKGLKLRYQKAKSPGGVSEADIAVAVATIEAELESSLGTYSPTHFNEIRKKFIKSLGDMGSVDHRKASDQWMLSGVRATLLGSLSQAELKKRKFAS